MELISYTIHSDTFPKHRQWENLSGGRLRKSQTEMDERQLGWHISFLQPDKFDLFPGHRVERPVEPRMEISRFPHCAEKSLFSLALREKFNEFSTYLRILDPLRFSPSSTLPRARKCIFRCFQRLSGSILFGSHAEGKSPRRFRRQSDNPISERFANAILMHYIRGRYVLFLSMSRTFGSNMIKHFSRDVYF